MDADRLLDFAANELALFNDRLLRAGACFRIQRPRSKQLAELLWLSVDDRDADGVRVRAAARTGGVYLNVAVIDTEHNIVSELLDGVFNNEIEAEYELEKALDEAVDLVYPTISFGFA